MRKLLLLLFVFFCFAYNGRTQCGPGQDTEAPVFQDEGDGTMVNPFRNLLQSTVGDVPSGTYYFNFNGNTFQGVLDNDTDGGGWLMILNYVHIAGDNSDLVIRNTDLPLLGSSTLGDNEAGTANWGHMGNTLAAAIDFEEIRFYGVTTGHNRIIDFKTNYTNVINYVKTGTGSFDGINISANHTTLPSHSANIPVQGINEFQNQGDLALTNFPFWASGSYHWGIKGAGNRWEVDDYAINVNSTIHRVWVRGDLSPAGSTTLNVDLDATGNIILAPEDIGLNVTDNCGAVDLSLSRTEFDCTDIGSHMLQLTATDTQNNTTVLNVTVTIQDTTAPVITAENSVQVSLDSVTGTLTLTPEDIQVSAIDNCELQSLVLDRTDFDCRFVGWVSVSIIATDIHGNIGQQYISILVDDITPPIVECNPPFSLELDATGNASITVDDLASSITDNCGVNTTIDISSFDCSNIGENTVTLTVNDNDGNVVVCTTTVTITMPSCPSDLVLENDPNTCGAVYNYPCASNITAGPVSGTVLAAGSTTTFAYETLDNEGATIQCSYDVTVSDTQFPLFNVKDHEVTINYNETTNVSVSDFIGADPLARDYTLDTSGTFDPVDISAIGAEVILEDDEVTEALPIGFEFGFYGNLYTEFYISSNGFITFSDEDDDGCCHGDVLPDTNEPNNLIAFDWTDINPEDGGIIRYTTIGTAPNRITIIDFDGVHYYDTTPDATTTQIKLFEKTNHIEIHGTSTFDAGNDKTQGIENIDGTAAIAVPGRNQLDWTSTNDFVAFVPISGVFDNCGVDTMEVSPSTFDINSMGDNLVTITITDVNGNVSEKTANLQVNVACFMYDLPDTNFQFLVSNETCTNKNNGILDIEASEPYNYIATMNGETYPFSSELTLSDLEPGNYPICIAIDGIEDCEKCYEFAIQKAPTLEGKTKVDYVNNKVYVDIESGSAPYIATLNNKVVGEYNTKSFTINATAGGVLEVFSSKAACQGKIATSFIGVKDAYIYPNPTAQNTTIHLPATTNSTVTVQIHNALGTSISFAAYNVVENKVELPMQSLPTGIYFVTVYQEGSKTIRVIKQ